MNRRKAAPVLVIGSLAVLLSGCAGAAAQGGQVQDNLSPLANAAEVGLARGHVVVREDLTPTRVENRIAALAAEQAVQEPRGFSADALRELHAQPAQQQSARSYSAEARRELHAQQAQSVTVEQPFSAEVWRELKGIAPATAEQPFSAEAIRELKGSAPVGVSAADMQGTRLSAYAEAQAAASVTAAEMQGARLSAYAEARTDAAIRELKGSAPVEVNDFLSPLRGGTSTQTAPADTVDDYLSPLGGSR